MLHVDMGLLMHAPHMTNRIADVIALGRSACHPTRLAGATLIELKSLIHESPSWRAR